MTPWSDALLAIFIHLDLRLSRSSPSNLLIRRPSTRRTIRLGRMDLWFFGAAILVLVTGFLRSSRREGRHFYLNAWPIYAKLGLFLLVGIISVAPDGSHFIRWRRMLDHDPRGRCRERSTRQDAPPRHGQVTSPR